MIIGIELILMGVTYINHEYSINYLDGLAAIEVVDDGYIAVGSSNFRNSKDVSICPVPQVEKKRHT